MANGSLPRSTCHDRAQAVSSPTAADSSPTADDSIKARPDKNGGVKINLQVVVFDAADLNAESTFWAQLLGGTVDAEDDWHMVFVNGEPKVGVQLAPDHVPPEWPDGTPQQIHLDLWVDDFEKAHTEVMSAGARLLQAATSTESADNFQVYADPAGHPFCLCWVKDV